MGGASRELLAHLGNAELTELNECEVCCGFGGLFSVKMPELSNAMLQNKVDNINDSAAETIVTGDVSCLTQMNGGLSRRKSGKRVVHLADVLAKALRTPPSSGLPHPPAPSPHLYEEHPASQGGGAR